MKLSTDRILTTHVGSLPRSPALVDLMRDWQVARGDPAAFSAAIRSAVAEIVRKQAKIGLDVVDDGEQSKTGFVSYVSERLAGFEPPKGGTQKSTWAGSREALAFPEFYAESARSQASNWGRVSTHWVCTGPVSYKGQAELRRDLDMLRAAIKDTAVAEAFVPAASPASIASWQSNAHYASDEAYEFAIAEAMREEYRAIVDAGFLLQVDDPQLVTHYVKTPGESLADCRRWAERSVETLNHALGGIPAEKVRHHTCYGINMGPRVHDMPMKDIVDIVLKINAGAYSFEAANPRHEHEWRIWQDVKLPEGKALIPGVISHTTVLVEHPELIAERIVRYAGLVGRERVIAGADCGFGTQAAATPEIHPTIVWAKLAALVEGARLATSELWGRG